MVNGMDHRAQATSNQPQVKGSFLTLQAGKWQQV
jgi:hypothetical protein